MVLKENFFRISYDDLTWQIWLALQGKWPDSSYWKLWLARYHSHRCQELVRKNVKSYEIGEPIYTREELSQKLLEIICEPDEKQLALKSVIEKREEEKRITEKVNPKTFM